MDTAHFETTFEYCMKYSSYSFFRMYIVFSLKKTLNLVE